jgi:hypothetical protein
MLNEIALRRLRLWVYKPGAQDLFQAKVVGFELGQLGFKLINSENFTSITRDEFAATIATLQDVRGGNVKYVPLFSRFPDDLPNDGEYLIRRVLGFFGLDTFAASRFGADPVTQMQRSDLWEAAVAAQSRRLSDSRTEWITLTLVSQPEAEQQLSTWAVNLIYGSTPVQEALWEDLLAVIDQLQLEPEIERVQIKETLARLAADQWLRWARIIVRTPTDLLRMFAALQGQDVSLATPIDLKGLKLTKPQRRAIVGFLSRCPALAEDLLRYRQLWISLSKWLHPGDFAKPFPAVARAFDDLRNQRVKSFESLVIQAPTQERIATLLERPSVFLRKISWLLNDTAPEVVTDAILSLKTNVANLPIPLLVTVYCALQYHGRRVVINKQGKSYTLAERQSAADLTSVLVALDTLILARLANSQNWQRVWIDPAMNKLVLPLQARKQADGLLNLARGSRIALNQEVIRLFVYWQDIRDRTDLDLSAMRLDANFNFVGHIGWNDYGSGADIAHSGDIQSAPLGAAEFIDLRLAALETGYILPAIIRFCGRSFVQLQACYAGWMSRTQSGADTTTFDAKTVTEKVNVNQDGRIWLPFLLDVAARELVYVDLYTRGARVVEANPHFPALAAGLAAYWQAKPTFGALANWYVRANGAMLVPRQDATTTIGTTDDCSINVFKLVGQGVTSFSYS